MYKRVCIVGSSAAGIAAAVRLRQLAPSADIICITAEAGDPYNKCLLVDVLSGFKLESEIITQSCEQLATKNIYYETATVTEIDRKNKLLKTVQGTTISYDALLLTVGTQVRAIPEEYRDINGVFVFHDRQDLISIKKYINNNAIQAAVIIGGGFTGLECADALWKLGLRVMVLERGDRVLGSIMHVHMSEQLIQHVHERTDNFVIQTNSKFSKIIEKFGICSGVEYITNKSHVLCDAQLVIFAWGVQSQDQLARSAGLECAASGGILVDEYMRSADPHIYAAGDCAFVLPYNSICRTWQLASFQGNIAAFNIAQARRSYHPITIHVSSHIGGVEIHSAGDPYSGGDLTFEKTDTYTLLQVKNAGKLAHYSCFGTYPELTALKRAMS